MDMSLLIARVKWIGPDSVPNVDKKVTKQPLAEGKLNAFCAKKTTWRIVPTSLVATNAQFIERHFRRQRTNDDENSTA